MDNVKQHLLLIDGMALLFRSFFATAVRKNFMINSAGIPTNAVQGYIKHVLTAIEHINPTHTAVCWDMGSVTFRNDLYDGYKANRPEAPVEMRPQFDLAKEVTTAFGILNIGIVGYEADDCIGTICEQQKSEYEVTVLTGDRDLLQLVDDQVNVFILQKGYGNYEKHTKASFLEEYQLHPRQFIDVKALMGDTSDGYPGVKGIGEKTAYKLIREHKDIESLLANIEKLAPSVQKKIQADLEMLHLSRTLAEIKCDVPLEFDILSAQWRDLLPSSLDIVNELELKTVRNYILQSTWGAKFELLESNV
ncbi:5'-3' exonuclease [Lederbergia graminis]|uniref:5'-3' exonuclease n=1 Tax=Lederbergia graminis TaxID=735518 RepID=A0ABW0LBU4_9BACI|nr:5'-3' exonuclease [Paenibacillus bovis]